MEYVLGLFLLIAVLIGLIPSFITFFSNDINKVDRFMRGHQGDPFWIVQSAMAKREYDKIGPALHRLGSSHKEMESMAIAYLQIERRELKLAEMTTATIKSRQVQHYNLALIALLQGEEETFQTHIKKVRHKGRHYALLANAAYKRGDYAEAERLGTLAISRSRGLKKWILVKAKEVQETNPTRELYF
ncbi:hypothetical protein OH784_25295 [Ectobacillus funiculus]|uniref:hypothetical protein n=1 Tax=Ectobacillus funiculus TaxID=137993 RepID=UPI00397A9B6D